MAYKLKKGDKLAIVYDPSQKQALIASNAYQQVLEFPELVKLEGLGATHLIINPVEKAWGYEGDVDFFKKGQAGTETDPVAMAHFANYSNTTEMNSSIDSKINSNNNNYYAKSDTFNKGETNTTIDTKIASNNANYSTTGQVSSTIDTKIAANNNNYYAKGDTFSRAEMNALIDAQRSIIFRFFKSYTTPLVWANNSTTNLFTLLSIANDIVYKTHDNLNHKIENGFYKFHSSTKPLAYNIDVRIYGTIGGGAREFIVEFDYAVNPTANKPIAAPNVSKNAGTTFIKDKASFVTYTTGVNDRFVTEGTKMSVINTAGADMSITDIAMVFTSNF